jgi:uncharacterized protein YfiM (DUF2279 family)
MQGLVGTVHYSNDNGEEKDKAASGIVNTYLLAAGTESAGVPNSGAKGALTGREALGVRKGG